MTRMASAHSNCSGSRTVSEDLSVPAESTSNLWSDSNILWAVALRILLTVQTNNNLSFSCCIKPILFFCYPYTLFNTHQYLSIFSSNLASRSYIVNQLNRNCDTILPIQKNKQ